MRNWIILLAALLLFSSHVTIAAPGEGIGECAWGSTCKRGLDGTSDIITTGTFGNRISTELVTLGYVDDPPVQACEGDELQSCTTNAECAALSLGDCVGASMVDITTSNDTDETLGNLFIATSTSFLNYLQIDPIPSDSTRIGRQFCLAVTSGGAARASAVEVTPGSGDRFRLGDTLLAVDASIQTAGVCADDDDDAGEACDSDATCRDAGDIEGTGECEGHGGSSLCFISRAMGGANSGWVTWGDPGNWKVTP